MNVLSESSQGLSALATIAEPQLWGASAYLWLIVALPALIVAYSYVVYPALVAVLSRLTDANSLPASDPDEWPTVSVSLPVYNEGRIIRDTLEALLKVDYPQDRLEIVVISDFSTDNTEAIVEEFASRNVRLLRQPTRQGKTAAECAGAKVVSGDIVINTDASTRFPDNAFKNIVRVFRDERIGLASGRDITVNDPNGATLGEGHYTSAEMSLRNWETGVDSIVGASGCFFAIRRELHMRTTPPQMSRDFSSAMYVRLKGFRAVSVFDAVCYVRLAANLRVEFWRKVRTMARGLDTLWYFRRALLPWHSSLTFSWLLFSHKLARWLVFFVSPFALFALILASFTSQLALAALGVILAVALLGSLALIWPDSSRMPKWVSMPGFILVAFAAGAVAWAEAFAARRNPIWSPTPRRLT